MANLEDFFFFNEEKKLNPNPMNVPSSPPPSCIPQMRCGERGSRTIWTTSTTTTVLLSLGTSSSSSFRTLHGLLQRSRKERKGKEGRKRVWRRRRLSSSSACVSVCAQFGRHLETRSQRQQRPSLIFSRCYIYSQKKATYFVNWKF